MKKYLVSVLFAALALFAVGCKKEEAPATDAIESDGDLDGVDIAADVSPAADVTPSTDVTPLAADVTATK